MVVIIWVTIYSLVTILSKKKYKLDTNLKNDIILILFCDLNLKIHKIIGYLSEKKDEVVKSKNEKGAQR